MYFGKVACEPLYACNKPVFPGSWTHHLWVTSRILCLCQCGRVSFGDLGKYHAFLHMAASFRRCLEMSASVCPAVWFHLISNPCLQRAAEIRGLHQKLPGLRTWEIQHSQDEHSFYWNIVVVCPSAYVSNVIGSSSKLLAWQMAEHPWFASPFPWSVVISPSACFLCAKFVCSLFLPGLRESLCLILSRQVGSSFPQCISDGGQSCSWPLTSDLWIGNSLFDLKMQSVVSLCHGKWICEG